PTHHLARRSQHFDRQPRASKASQHGQQQGRGVRARARPVRPARRGHGGGGGGVRRERAEPVRGRHHAGRGGDAGVLRAAARPAGVPVPVRARPVLPRLRQQPQGAERRCRLRPPQAQVLIALVAALAICIGSAPCERHCARCPAPVGGGL
uniref:Uncharacterized protein n=1 Tax=Triticum urartu TaxID=4572 RepID=A0A8R7P799_TRIUA